MKNKLTNKKFAILLLVLVIMAAMYFVPMLIGSQNGLQASTVISNIIAFVAGVFGFNTSQEK